MASYAETFMQVVTDDGKTVRYDVDHVSEVNFIKEEIIPQDTTSVIPQDTISSNHAYVDLDLPSGTLWATYNVGATKPEEYGDYFAWGETEPKKVYDWNTYKYATATYNNIWDEYELDSITKYNMSGHYGIIDSLSVLLPEDDAATANWGKEWHMPTNEEQRELWEECYMVWTYDYNGSDVSGVIFYKAKSTDDKGTFVDALGTPSSDYSTSADAHVFFPAAGGFFESHVGNVGHSGFYWSSSLYGKNEYYARYLSFFEKDTDYDFHRGSGFTVRAVRVQK